jgi:disease resistance protein RPM1
MQGLQILDMGDTYITTLPKEITELRDLRIIRCFRKDYSYLDPDEPVHCLFATLCLPILIANSYNRALAVGDLHMGCSSGWSRTVGDGVRVPRGIGNLKELEILEYVDIRRTSSKAIKELGKVIRLRKLTMATEGASKKKCKILCESIKQLSSLRSLSVRDRGLGWLISSSSPPPHLRSLKLYGYIGEMTDWFRNLTQLVKISLGRCQLKEDKTMEILGELPKLMLLRFLDYACHVEKLVFGTGAFLNLRTLEIWGTPFLNDIRFEEGTSPQMESIEIKNCFLKSEIIGVKHLQRLKMISLDYHSKVARLRMLEEQVNAHSNHPVLRLSEDRKFHDLGDVEGSNVEVEATESVPDHAGEISQVITLTTTDRSANPVQ